MPSIYFSEAFPLSHREIGAAVTICINNSVGSALSLTWPSLLARVGPTASFGLYAGLNTLAFIVIFLIIPETKYVCSGLPLLVPYGYCGDQIAYETKATDFGRA